MTLTKEQIDVIEKTIENSLRKKFKSYKPETKFMPFHYRLLGKDRMALYSFIHSLNTHFGTAIYEPVAETLADLNYNKAKMQFPMGNNISEKAQIEIQNIINELSMGNDPKKLEEINRIRKVCIKGKINKLRTVKADLLLESSDGTIHLFDLKTTKPNKGNFKDFKRTLLEWIAIYLYKNPEALVHSYIALPYNPYEPKPYERWTMKGMIDINNELRVGDEFWDFLGGKGAYSELLDCFERVGIRMVPEIDDYFSHFK